MSIAIEARRFMDPNGSLDERIDIFENYAQQQGLERPRRTDSIAALNFAIEHETRASR